jgi:hypothetical protein
MSNTKIVLTKHQLTVLRQVAGSAKGETHQIDLKEAEALCDLGLAEFVGEPQQYQLTLWGRTALKDYENEKE